MEKYVLSKGVSDISEEEGILICDGGYPYRFYRTVNTTELLDRWIERMFAFLEDFTGAPRPLLMIDRLGPGDPVMDTVPEILIGNTHRYPVSEERDSLGYDEFVIRAEGKKLLMFGRTRIAACAAIWYLIEFIKTNYEKGCKKIVFPYGASYRGKIPDEIREYRGSLKGFQITYFPGKWQPNARQFCENEEYFEKTVDAGFTVIPVPGGTEDILRAVKKLNARGVKTSVYDFSIGDLTKPERRASEIDVTDEAAVAELVGRYRDSGIFEWWLVDEPWVDHPELAALSKHLKKLDPERGRMINNLADPHLTDGYFYEHFLEYYSLPYISLDLYCFLRQHDAEGYPEYKDKYDCYFYSLQKAILVAEAHGTEAAMITLLCCHFENKNSNPTIEHLRWECNTALALGFKTISYFYWQPVLQYMDEGDSTYYDNTKQINSEIYPIGCELYAKHPVDAYFIESTKKFNFVKYYSGTETDLGEVGGDRAMLGLFDDRSVYFVDLYFDTKDGSRHDHTLGAVKPGAFEYFDRAAKGWKALEESPEIRYENGLCTLSLRPGDGMLIRKKS